MFVLKQPYQVVVVLASVLLVLYNPSCCNAWAPPSSSFSIRSPLLSSPNLKRQQPSKIMSRMNDNQEYKQVYDPLFLDASHNDSQDRVVLVGALALFLLATPQVANAAESSPSVIGSAFAAYGHYLSILVCLACTVTERLTIKANMSNEEEDRIAIADTLLGVFGALLAYTGYLRIVKYGKGWDFYAHEPIFWLKLTFVGVWGGLSFFNTTKIIQRSVAKQQNGGEIVEPMSEKLAYRMNRICTAELSALLSIPLTATLMSRGFLYTDSIPWQVGAGIFGLTFVGSSYVYLKEAFTWTEDEEVEVTVAD